MKENSAIIQVQLPVEVATFLLNEKRADIHKIEQRMGVEVVLIPNIHLETPNYNIVRIKHDDVSHDTSRASYKMVELPTETSYLPNPAEEAKAIKPVAAVRGITPSAPAPIVAEKSEPAESLLSRAKKFFSSLFPAKKKVHEKTSESRREGGRNRNRNRNRNRSERNEKNAGQQERGQKMQEARAQEPRETKAQEQRQQKPQQQRNESPRQDHQRTQPVENTAGETGERNERSGRRSRNNRRNRRDREDNTARETQRTFIPNEELSPATANPATEATPSESVKPEVSANQLQSEIVAQAAEHSVETKVTNAPTEATIVETADDQANATTKIDEPKKSKSAKVSGKKSAEKVTEENLTKSEVTNEAESEPVKSDKKRPARGRKPKAESKPANLAAEGLQLVETKAEAVKATVIESEEPKPRKPRKSASWQKQESAESDQAPLVMVETQNK